MSDSKRACPMDPSDDVIYFSSEKCFSDEGLVCPMDPSEPSERRFVHRSQIASIGHICDFQRLNAVTRKDAKKRTVCRSYSGATVEQIATKFDQHSKEDQSFDKVIIHVGTNDLVRTQPDKVAQNMESLIVKVKSQAKQVAASAVVRRYDNKVKPHCKKMPFWT